MFFRRVVCLLAAVLVCALLPVGPTWASAPPASLGLRFLRSDPQYPDPGATSFRLSGTLPAGFPVRVNGSRLVAAPGSLPAGKTAAVYAAGGDYPLQYLGHARVAADGSLSLDLVRFVDGRLWGGGDVWVVLSETDLPVDRAVNGDFSAGTEGWEPYDPAYPQYYALGLVENGAGKIVDKSSPTPDDTFGQSMYGSLGNLEVLAKLKVPWGEVCVGYRIGEHARLSWSLWHDEPLPEEGGFDYGAVRGLSRGYRSLGGGWWELWARVPARPDMSHVRVWAAPGGWLSSEYGYLDDFRCLDYGMPGWRSPVPPGWKVHAFDGQDFQVPDTALDSSSKYDWYRGSSGLLGVQNGAMRFEYGEWYRCSRVVPVVREGRVRLTCQDYTNATSELYLEWLDAAGNPLLRTLVGTTSSSTPSTATLACLEREFPVPPGVSGVRLAFRMSSLTGYLDYWWVESLAPSP